MGLVLGLCAEDTRFDFAELVKLHSCHQLFCPSIPLWLHSELLCRQNKPTRYPSPLLQLCLLFRTNVSGCFVWHLSLNFFSEPLITGVLVLNIGASFFQDLSNLVCCCFSLECCEGIGYLHLGIFFVCLFFNVLLVPFIPEFFPVNCYSPPNLKYKLSEEFWTWAPGLITQPWWGSVISSCGILCATEMFSHLYTSVHNTHKVLPNLKFQEIKGYMFCEWLETKSLACNNYFSNKQILEWTTCIELTKIWVNILMDELNIWLYLVLWILRLERQKH